MKLKLFSIIIIFSLLLVSCTKEVNLDQQMGEIYNVALESLMELDKGLNGGMEYIAIDMSNLDLSDNDRAEIMDFLKNKYNVDVKSATYEELKEQGLYNPENMVLDGVLLKIEKVDFKDNNDVQFELSKYRAPLGAIGLEVVVHYKDGKWQIKEKNNTWIS